MHYTIIMWQIVFTARAAKQAKRLSERVLLVLQALTIDLTNTGGIAHHWPNYGKLRGKLSQDNRHCHLIKGNPTYVCCWRIDKQKQLIEVYYVGTHEKAPY